MRITQGMINDRLIGDLSRGRQRLAELQDRLASGSRLTKPSDDPMAVAEGMRLSSNIAAGERHLVLIAEARNWMESTEQALSGAADLLQRARELAVQGANDTIAAGDRRNMAAEAREIFSGLLETGNQELLGRYLFGGRRTTAPPFVQTGTDPREASYEGDGDGIARPIGSGRTIMVNVTGDRALSPALEAVSRLEAALRNDGLGEIQGALGDLDAALDRVVESRIELGARLNRLERTGDRLEDLQAGYKMLLSKIQDVDLAEVLVEFQAEQNSYRAALGAASRIMDMSLLDFLA
ncbi:MAG: flagellar hook-associated protein FlgL [Firmicutes bacterium]|nr:flagellar hook-associated protein FlgL [Bacillota bacterium]